LSATFIYSALKINFPLVFYISKTRKKLIYLMKIRHEHRGKSVSTILINLETQTHIVTAGPARTPTGRKPRMGGRVPTRGIGGEGVQKCTPNMGLPAG